jgi:hypothetical protein
MNYKNNVLKKNIAKALCFSTVITPSFAIGSVNTIVRDNVIIPPR